MGSRVSISKRAAQALLDLCCDVPAFVGSAVVAELRAGLASQPKKTLSFKSRKQVKAKKDRTKRAQTKDIRAAVVARAGGHCECGCGMSFTAHDPPELDHMFGRVRAKQSERNTWLLSRSHHRLKTENGFPGPAGWLEAFIRHAEKHGYSEEAGMATRLLGKNQIKAELSRGAP